tara:strand:- start:25 stop:138 length:114 start_codon:yes stop_codon:yes gene_type:complete
MDIGRSRVFNKNGELSVSPGPPLFNTIITFIFKENLS